ncbi:polynucleotide kinase 3 phosphatase [Amylocarpus encephaloides]|uniref:Polynucleotide kinase 3 phosphatase n=1 Tax=Amylocarpus encephaloides TaxID=45428 RepID=A0A9P7YB74_9HELO|nr:polynucleotide kinase 3 phosphatase [Amylocarpus encephaloides]
MSTPAKRKHNTLETPDSPPLSRRKVQSTTTKTAVASFFTPTSKKPPEQTVWQERAADDDSPNTLLVGKYSPDTDKGLIQIASETQRKKVAAFDFDSTLIQTSSGKKFASDSNDWKWWHPSVPGRLRMLHAEEGYRIVVISNQGGLSLNADSKAPKSKVPTFKAKVSAVFNQLDMPISIYAATGKDIYRKPRSGMWSELLDDYDIHSDDLDLEHSVFVGDAGGRHAGAGKPKDFSCSDRNFAGNLGLRFHTPEEFFLNEEPRPFTRTFEPSNYLSEPAAEAVASFSKMNDQDLIIFCGSPGAGKSTFYWRNLGPIGYARVNQDILKTREKCLKVAEEYLKEGKSVVIDNTNADSEVRGKWVQLASTYSVPIRCVHFTATTQLCEHNDVVRALNKPMNPEKRTVLPSLAFKGFASRYQAPTLSEGFQDVVEISFKFEGNEEEKAVWSRHWT